MVNLVDLTIADLLGRIVLIVAALSVVIQISPIKINPWTWLAKKIGKAVNGEVIERVAQLEIDLDEMRAGIDEQNAKTNRTKILRFGDEIMHEVKHSKDHFDEIMNCISDYDLYCQEHPAFVNHMTKSTTKRIVETYEKCMKENSFL